MVYALIGFAILVVGEPITARLQQYVVAFFNLLPMEVCATIAIAIPITSLLVVGLRYPGPLNPRYFPTYPPIWMSAVAAMALYGFVVSTTEIGSKSNVDHAITTWNVVSLIVLFLIAWLIVACVKVPDWFSDFNLVKPNTDKSQDNDAPRSLDDLSNDINKILFWISSDVPIEEQIDDLFEHRYLARRIARRLHKHQSARGLPTFGVYGRLGSGKSSIMNLLGYYLERSPKSIYVDQDSNTRLPILPPRYIVCRVSLWGFSDFESVVRHLLEKATDSLAPHVDCISLHSLPDHVSETLSSQGGFFGKLGTTFLHRSTPDRLLQQLGKVLVAANIRLVICLEDTERVQRSHQTVEDVISLSTLVQLTYGLLDKLQAIPGVSYVLTRDYLDGMRTDHARLVRFVEHIPPLDLYLVWRMLTVFRSHALAQDDIVHTVDAERTRYWPGLDVDAVSIVILDDVSIVGAIAALAGTPRTLKMSMRHTWAALTDGRLRGEVDVDDLLITSLIRFAAPTTWDCINENIAPLRYGGISGEKHSVEMATKFKDDLERCCEQDGVKRASIELLLSFLFPNNSFILRTAPVDRQALQGVSAVRTANDYWQRIVNGELEPDALLDQEILQSIKGWLDHPGQSVLPSRYIESSEVRVQVKRFSGLMIPSDQILALLEQIFEQTFRECSPTDVDTEFFYSIADLIKEQPGGALPDYRDWLDRQLSGAAGWSIEWFGVLLYRYLSKSHVGGSVLAKLNERECGERALSEFNRLLRNNPEKFNKVVRGCHASALLDLLVWTPKGEEKSTTPPEALWGFGDTILNACDSRPELAFPVLVPLLAMSSGKDFMPREEFLEKLFVDRQRLWRLIEKGDPEWIKEEGWLAWLEFLKIEAKKQLQS